MISLLEIYSYGPKHTSLDSQLIIEWCTQNLRVFICCTYAFVRVFFPIKVSIDQKIIHYGRRKQKIEFGRRRFKLKRVRRKKKLWWFRYGAKNVINFGTLLFSFNNIVISYYVLPYFLQVQDGVCSFVIFIIIFMLFKWRCNVVGDDYS